MEDEVKDIEVIENEDRSPEVIYKAEKDFYRGMGGELRYKAEGLFKKAKEKGISIEDVSIETVKENSAEFPGLGVVELPALLVRIKGRHLGSGQIMADAKQIDYFNRYQRYVADKIEGKNYLRDEKGKVIRAGGKPKTKSDLDISLTEWERFEIGRDLVDDKEFGLEKTVTGACDRVIRKLMGENDWLYPNEAKLLDEEYNKVQAKIAQDQEIKKQGSSTAVGQRRATDRQINFLKSKIRNLGLDPESDDIIKSILKQAGFETPSLGELSTGDMSKIIDNIGSIVQRMKEEQAKRSAMHVFGDRNYTEGSGDLKQ